MDTFKVSFSNGDELTTGFNGTIQEAKQYYVNKFFNMGNGEADLMVKGTKVKQVF